MIVIDASLLTDFLIGRGPALDALGGALAGRDHEPLHAPELIEPEVLNALRRLGSSGSISERRAGEAVHDLANARLLRYPHAPLREAVWALRHELSAYDATYLALAVALDASVLVTADRGLAGRAAGHMGRDRVRHVR